MSLKANYFKIGLFVIGAVILGVAAVIILGAGTVFQAHLIIETYFDGSVQGLSLGSPVKFRGVEIGKVNHIGLVSRAYPTDLTYILVRMSLPEDSPWFGEAKAIQAELQKQMEKGLRVRLAQQGLTGSAYLEVDYLEPLYNPPLETKWKPEYPYLPSARSVITQLSDSLSVIMRSLEKIDITGITVRLDKTLDSLTRKIEEANVADISLETKQLLVEIRKTNTFISGFLGGDQAQKILTDASQAAASIRLMTVNAEKPVASLLQSLQKTSQSINQITNKLDSFSGELPQAVVQLRTTLTRLDNLVSGQQQDIEATVNNIRIITENLRELTETSKRYPASILFGRPPAPIAPGETR
ncbi:MAG: MlaD family protein [Pseudomonadota bacterium]